MERDDAQLELAEVKARFVESEAHLNRLAESARGLDGARDSLEGASAAMAGTGSELAAASGELANLSERLLAVVTAFESADPDAILLDVRGLREDVASVRSDLATMTGSLEEMHEYNEGTSTIAVSARSFALYALIASALTLLGVLVLLVR